MKLTEKLEGYLADNQFTLIVKRGEIAWLRLARAREEMRTKPDKAVVNGLTDGIVTRENEIASLEFMVDYLQKEINEQEK